MNKLTKILIGLAIVVLVLILLAVGLVLRTKYCDHRLTWYAVPTAWLGDGDIKGSGETTQRQFRQASVLCPLGVTCRAGDIVQVRGVGMAKVMSEVSGTECRVLKTDGSEMTIKLSEIVAHD